MLFSDFLITLDFANFKLILGPLPGGLPDRERTHDRVISPELVGFTPVFRIGHTLLVRTRISDFGPVLFVLDTGASTTLISKKAAAEATKVSADNSVILKGLSGRVKDVAQADELYLQFAGFRQKHLGMMAFDLDDTSKNTGIEISGLLGLPLLHLFTITIDYPDGMVKFEYKPL